jgi:DNA-binding MarR family transcriptional regulator
MEIEKEIYNRKFENSHQKAVVNLLYTYGWITNLLRLLLNKHNVTLQQYNILRILRGHHPNPATINILKERMLDKMSDASRIVERLVQKDLVIRCVSDKDRRAVDILISQNGLDILQKLDTEISLKAMLSNNISEEEASTLSGLLDKMRG